MRKEYGKALRDQFDKLMKEHLPEFSLYKTKTMYLFPGERAYCREAENEPWSFIVLSPDSKGREAFTLELGWSTQKRFPELGMRPSFIPSTSRDEFSEPEAMTRLPLLYGGEEWWLIEQTADPLDYTGAGFAAQQRKVSAQEAREKIMPLLENAMQKLSTVGIEYLHELLSDQTSRVT